MPKKKKSSKSKKPYNKGDAYEDKIFRIMEMHNITPKGSRRAGAGTGTDCIFITQGKEYNLEIKKDLKADYGQKTFHWSNEMGWSWSIKDDLTDFFDKFHVIELLNKKNISPNKFTKLKEVLTLEDKKSDQTLFEDRTLRVPAESLFNFYKRKGCSYLQVGEGFGFYNLGDDPANLGVPEFHSDFMLRLRAKTIRSLPIWNYTFYAVLKVVGKPEKSTYNLEESKAQPFPKIKP